MATLFEGRDAALGFFGGVPREQFGDLLHGQPNPKPVHKRSRPDYLDEGRAVVNCHAGDAGNPAFSPG